MNSPNQNKPTPVPSSSRRDFIVALLCGLAVLSFLVYGISVVGARQQKASTNTLTGRVVEKKFTPGPEEQVSFGRSGVRSEQIAGEYTLRVHVALEDRTFEIPVDANTFEAVRIGSNFSFVRPRSEQVK
jgi:hypothetical protein